MDNQKRLNVLQNISFGSQVAEEEIDNIKNYFVETDIWHRLKDDDIDIVYGYKGAGKSALYLLLNSKADAFRKLGTHVISAENPRGDTIFSNLKVSPPPDEREFINLWKLYLLAVITNQLSRENIDHEDLKKVQLALRKAKILPSGGTLNLSQIFSFVKDYFLPKNLKVGAGFDPLSNKVEGEVEIIFREKTFDEHGNEGVQNIDELFQYIARTLEYYDNRIWLLIDRLDVAFADTPDLERNALRALFKTYRDLSKYDCIRVKIFLRTDIWNRITADGFREATHITREASLTWSNESIFNLIVKRLL